VVSLLVSVICLGASVGAGLADQLDDETRRIAKQLQCPICESVSVADSTAELAAQMRAVIRKKLENGESEAEIIAYFVERYGEGVRTEPGRSGFSSLVWIAPVVAILTGLGLLIAVLRIWLRRPSRLHATEPLAQLRRNGIVQPGKQAPSPQHLDRARREFERFGSLD
jgi:cytochrome c-type biogenesis protein CcmH